MKRPLLTLKNKSFSVYLFFALYVLSGAFFIAESCVPGTLSANQSNGVAQVVAAFLNLFGEGQTATQVEPTELTLLEDTSFLNLADASLAKPSLAYGTTSALHFSSKAPSLQKGEYLDPAFSVKRRDGSSDENYSLLVDSVNKMVRIVAKGVSYEGKITVLSGLNATYDYSFSVVENPAPKAYSLAFPDGGYSLAKGESVTPKLTLVDPRETTAPKSDNYLRRYYDPTKLAYSVSGAGISLSEQGVILGKEAGSYTASIGKYTIPVRVKDETYALPDATSSLSLAKRNPDEKMALQDYDYGSGVTLTASWAGKIPQDSSLSWSVDDPMVAKLSPAEDGLSCLVEGYRKKGSVTVKAVSNVDSAIAATIVLESEETVPTETSWHLVYTFSGSGASSPAAGTISAHVGSVMILQNEPPEGVNITNNALAVVSHSGNIGVAGEGSALLSLSFKEAGDGSLVVAASGNPSLTTSLSFTILAAPNVNPEDSGFTGFIRKLVGHGSWFAIMAVFGFLFYLLDFDQREKIYFSMILSFGGGLLIASLSELIQHFVPGRYGALADIGIDCLGYLIGTLVAFGVTLLVWHLRKKKAAKPS